MTTIKSLKNSMKFFEKAYRGVDFSDYSAEDLQIPLKQIVTRRNQINSFLKSDNSKNIPPSVKQYQNLLKRVEERIVGRNSKIRICFREHPENNTCGFCFPKV